MSVITTGGIMQPGTTGHGPESDIVFGSTLTTLCTLATILPQALGGQPNPVALMLAAICLLLTMWYPQTFTPFNNALKALGTGFSHLFITLFWVFYILPSGLIMQARGRDPLRLRFQPEAKTYWETSPAPTSMQKSL